jgi:hypothetical protein
MSETMKTLLHHKIVSECPRHLLYNPLLRLVLNLGLKKILLNHRNIIVKGPEN